MAAVLTVGTLGWARGPYGGGMGGPCWQAAGVDNQARQQFLDETAELRGQLAEKSARLRALSLQADADPTEIGTLTKEVAQLQNQIRGKAQELGVPCPRGGRGYHMGAGMGAHRGYGPCWNASAAN
ncbi:MAG: hypothetical protein D6722_27995 [Bacteroidetes bacterium]|nr:MAG: hypothetical protein D6722_27995 [Bacteroidota bacterium]